MNTGSPEHSVQAIIDEALAFGSANYGKPYSGKSELHNILERNARAAIVGLALGHVMRQRTGEKCGDKNLAYADHYLQARVMVAYLGPSGYHVAKSAVVGYEALKKVFDMLGILHALASDNQCPEPV